jgi:tRNA threonylcarbamoyladenosine biosynthesis protein TsaB
LPPLVERMLAQSQLPAASLRRIAVTVGPGAFTGVRVGLAFAKGLALALKVPLLGYTTLECLAAQARAARGGAASYACVIDARRGEVYAQGLDADMQTVFGPAVMTVEAVLEGLDRLARPLVLTGSGAGLIAVPNAERLDMQTIDAHQLALVALRDDPATHPPVPCYLRAPDARLPS